MITIGRRVVVDYQDLLDEHAAIDRLSQELENVAREGQAEPERAQLLLRQLAGVVAAHLRKEESFVYPGLASVTDRPGAAGAVLEFEALKREWERYLDTWQRAGALAEWQRFAHDTVAALQSLRERAMAEVEELYVMGLREGLVRLRPAAIAGSGGALIRSAAEAPAATVAAASNDAANRDDS